MRTIATLCLSTLLLVAGNVQAQDTAQDAARDGDCANAETQLALNICAAEELDRADAALDAIWERAEARAESEGAETVGTLREAQRSWTIYRDSHCAFEGGRFEGGSMAPMMVAGCLSALTLERTRLLMEYVESP